MKKLYTVVTLLLVTVFVLSSCAQQPAAATDKLAEVLARGTMVVSTDPAYPPQSELVEGAERLPNTKCAADQQTANQMQGFDIDVAKAIGEKLGVEVCFLTVAWDLIVSGNWANRFDISIGSVTVTSSRMEVLYFTQPYYTTPAAFFVHQDNTTFAQPTDLSGKKIGSCSGCTYDAYLNGELEIPPFGKINPEVENIIFTGYDTDTSALQDLALGDGVRLDGVLTAQPTGAGTIADGLPLKQLGDEVFFEYLAGAVDKAATPNPVPFVQRVSEIIEGLHSDGTLLRLSQQYYGADLVSAAGDYDLTALSQWP